MFADRKPMLLKDAFSAGTEEPETDCRYPQLPFTDPIAMLLLEHDLEEPSAKSLSHPRITSCC